MLRHLEKTGRTLLPLDSSEALWEWHIPSDRLFWTSGACQEMRLTMEEAPRSMEAFVCHVSAETLPHLEAVHESVLSGVPGNSLNCTYVFDFHTVHERMVVVQRDDKGRAVLAVGHYSVEKQENTGGVAFHTPGRLSEIGFWLCSSESELVHMDEKCASLLGYAPEPLSLDLELWCQHLNFSEACGLRWGQLRYQDTPPEGNLESLLHINRKDGSLTVLLLRASVLQRDEKGQALTVTGFLQDVLQCQGCDESAKLLLTVNATGDGLWDWDTQRNEIFYSARYLGMLGYEAQDFGNRPEAWTSKLHPDDEPRILPALQLIVETPRHGDTFESTYRLRHADGHWVWVLGRGYVTQRDAKGRAARIVGMHTNVSAMQSEREELEEKVKHDSLTGLRSRAFCELEMERLEKEGVSPMCIIVGDVCGLKMINDNLGHAMGDRLLQQAARMMTLSLRTSDCIARVGGDEFVILLPHCSEKKGREIMRHVMRTVEMGNSSGAEVPVIISFGLAARENKDISLIALQKMADQAMLEHKAALRPMTHGRIKEWIENRKKTSISMQDERIADGSLV